MNKRSWIVMQVGTGKVDGWYSKFEEACQIKTFMDEEYPQHHHRVLEAYVDVPWFPLSAANNDLRSPPR